MVQLVFLPKAEPLRAIVTGAAEGVGAECARALAGNGVRVAIVDIDKVPLARLANEIHAHAFACDVLSEHSVNQMIAQSLEALGGADLLINAAGKGYVRALGMMRVSRALAQAAAGSPVTIANIAAATTRLEQFGYAGSKQAFRRLSDGLGRKLSADGVTVVTADDLQDETAVGGFVARLCQTARSAPLPAAVRSASG